MAEGSTRPESTASDHTPTGARGGGTSSRRPGWLWPVVGVLSAVLVVVAVTVTILLSSNGSDGPQSDSSIDSHMQYYDDVERQREEIRQQRPVFPEESNPNRSCEFGDPCFKGRDGEMGIKPRPGVGMLPPDTDTDSFVDTDAEANAIIEY